MKISKIMIPDVHTCDPGDDLSAAARIMYERHIGCVPIVDAEKRLVGILTDRDICMAAYMLGWPLYEIKVADVMSRNVVFTSVDASISEAEKMMRTHRVHRLPVLDSESKVVGIISLTDLTCEARREVGRKVAEITAEDVMDVLASISERRDRSTPVH